MTIYDESLNELHNMRQAYERLAYDDPYVARIRGLLHNGISEVDAMKFVIVAMAANRIALVKMAQELASIVPRRFQCGEQEIYRWDAPDSMVPITKSRPGP